MALVSPGIQITVTDETQYVSSQVGTVPFIVMATAENKSINGAIAGGTLKANAGALFGIGSQRELVSTFGYPNFRQSAAGTPLNGDELNEYGLMAAYSSLGLGNRIFVMRADIDLNELVGTTVRPIDNPANGTYWLDTTNTAWGIYQWNKSTGTFTEQTVTVIDNAGDTTLVGNVPTPNSSVGQIGSYSVVVTNPNNYMFYKRNDNIWVQVGSTQWQQAWPAVQGTVVNPTLTANASIQINNQTITTSGTSVASLASDIISANIAGVTSSVVNGQLAIYATSASASNGVNVDGKVNIQGGATWTTAGITTGVYSSPQFTYASYVNVPAWRTSDADPAPTGSVWFKTTAIGNGANLVINKFNSETDTWASQAVPLFFNEINAIYGLDPAGGGAGIAVGTIYGRYDTLNNNTASVRPFVRTVSGAVTVTTPIPSSPLVFNINDSFTMQITQPGQLGTTLFTVTLAGTNSAAFVAAILAQNMPNIDAKVEVTGAISVTHRTGGQIVFRNIVGTPLTTAGFSASLPHMRNGTLPGSLILSGFDPLVYTFSKTQPYQAPADGTLWYYSSATDVDIMINDTSGWKGYQNVTVDARGYDLSLTDPLGPIISPTQPVTQSDSTPLVPGDLWIDTSDLEHFPVIRRFTTTGAWALIDNADRITENGVVFADARWDSDGTTDPITGALPSIVGLLTSNYLDLDAPDYRLYPRGTLLFNLRRSGYNIKKYVSNYFNAHAFPNVTLPAESATWVTASGLRNDGSPYMGHNAQRQMVVKALKAAIDGSTQIREEAFNFNLIAAPGYPELIPNMVALNNDKANVAFVVGDTPMTLPSDTVSLTNWSNDTNGDGIATADPYLAVFYPSGLTNDVQGNTIVVPPSHMMLRTIIHSDNQSYPWFAPAGTRRGLIDNASSIGYVDVTSGAFVQTGVAQQLRDTLFQLNINPLTVLSGVGLVNFGQLTRSGTSTALSRINVARLVNYVRTVLSSIGNNFLFEPNDKITRDQVKQSVESILNDLVAKRGIYDYSVVCDDSNNTPDRIARSELYVDIGISPMRDVEFIFIPIRLTNPGTQSSSQ